MVANSNIIDALNNRRSASSKKLVEPAPSQEEIDTLINTAMTAPDFGRLRPWQYLIIQGDARTQLGELFYQSELKAQAHSSEPVDPAKAEHLKTKPLRAPLVIIAIAKLTHHNKASEQDQIISAALGAHHIQLAAQAMNYDSIWLSGPMTRNSYVKEGLHLNESDNIIGFLYIGTEEKPKTPKRPDAQRFIKHWP